MMHTVLTLLWSGNGSAHFPVAMQQTDREERHASALTHHRLRDLLETGVPGVPSFIPF